MTRRIHGTAQTRQCEQETTAVGTVKPRANGIATPEGVSLRATVNKPSGAVSAMAISGVARTSQGDKPARQVWDGDRRVLGREAIEKWKRGEIKARTARQAVKIWCAPYDDEFGVPIDAASVYRNVEREEEDKNREEFLRNKRKIVK
jgi:hypothetical protein